MAKETKEKEKRIVKPCKVTVSKTVLGQEEITEETIEVDPFVTDPAIVSIELGGSVQRNDSTWVRAAVTIAMPCYKEEVPEMCDKVFDLCRKKVSSYLNAITKGKS